MGSYRDLGFRRQVRMLQQLSRTQGYYPVTTWVLPFWGLRATDGLHGVECKGLGF